MAQNIDYSMKEHPVASERSELTTTSYALLGLLAIRPWSTYELAKQMQRGPRFFWPRTESNLYAEPKKLLAHGLAKAVSQPHGKRRRTVYSITAEGRRTLTAWLKQPSSESRWESETLVKVVFAENGTRSDLLDRLHDFRTEAEARSSNLKQVVGVYLEGKDPFPGRTHLNVLASRLVFELARTEATWANWAISEVEQWHDTATIDDREHILDLLRQALEHRPA